MGFATVLSGGFASIQAVTIYNFVAVTRTVNGEQKPQNHTLQRCVLQLPKIFQTFSLQGLQTIFLDTWYDRCRLRQLARNHG